MPKVSRICEKYVLALVFTVIKQSHTKELEIGYWEGKKAKKMSQTVFYIYFYLFFNLK